MSDFQTTVSAERIELQLDAGAFPRDAVYAAAYTFIDRCYVRLDQPAPGRIGIVLRAKTAGSLDGAATAAELENELLGQAWRQRIADEGSELTASIAAAAFGVSGSPTDDPLADGADAFDDPLGIAMSWEEKYAGKIGAEPAPADSAAATAEGAAAVASGGEQGT